MKRRGLPYPDSLGVPGQHYSLIPDGDLQPVGVNGLPPGKSRFRDVGSRIIDEDGHNKGRTTTRM